MRTVGKLAPVALFVFTASLGLAQNTEMPNVDLGRSLAGEPAITALDKHLPSVAKAHGMSQEAFRETLTKDKSAKLDRKGRMFFTDPALKPAEGSATDTTSPQTQAAESLEQTFKLHSRPGARLIIYLDFDGHYLTGSAWNSGYNGGNPINCPPWDIDGNPGVFGPDECGRIQQIWRRVSEDYAGFNVDVTTEYPGEAALTRTSSSDIYYGMRVLISPISSYFGQYGGIAYVNVFGNTGDTYKPALVFPENLANGEKYIAEACSHECGHTLSLRHDGITGGDAYYTGHGSGETGWAPIMGAGYYKNLTQWSKGTYTGANNTEDDLALISGHLQYATDDYGNDRGSSAVLPPGTQLNVNGVIERNTDIDVFRFTVGPGTISAAVSPAGFGPNLDIAVQLRDANDVLVASANPTDLLGANLNASVNSGTYYLRVQGAAKADPGGYTTYGSLGAYTIALTVPASSGNLPPVAAASADKLSGPAPLTVTFSSSGSQDPEGGALAYAWSFGDGATSSAPNPSYTYSAPGSYIATLQVTDSSGAKDDASLVITVTVPNVAPVAIASASVTAGVAPLAVTFSSTGSYDSDGTIASYRWDFGDGTSANGATATHTYTQAGTYTATLTVTDNAGGANTSSVSLQVSPVPLLAIKVQSIALSITSTRSILGTVQITDSYGSPVANALVAGSWTGSVTGNTSAMTDQNGFANLTSKRAKNRGTATFKVTNVTKSGCAYTPSANVVSQAQIQTASTP